MTFRQLIPLLWMSATLAGGITDMGQIRQIFNNFELLQQQITYIEELDQLIETYEQKYKHLQNAEQQIEGSIVSITNTPDLTSLSKLRSATKSLYGSLTDAAASTTKLQQQVSLSGLTPTEFVAKVTGDRSTVLSQNTQNLMQNYLDSMNEVGTSYSNLQKNEAAIASQPGMEGALKTINMSMDNMLTQNARMMQMWASFINNEAVHSAIKNQTSTGRMNDLDAFINSNAAAIKEIEKVYQ